MARRRLLGGAGLAAAAAAVLAVAAPPAPPPAPAADCAAAVVVMADDADQDQRDSVRAMLALHPAVRDFAYQGGEDVYDRFRQLWSGGPDVSRAALPVRRPDRFRVLLTDPAAAGELRDLFAGHPGVQGVTGRCG